MNTYERFQWSLIAEFKQKAPPQFRSLWADLLELEGATDERAFAAGHGQALLRIRALGCAANAARAYPVPSLSRSLELKLRPLTRARVATHPESVEGLHRTMNQIAEALCTSDDATPAPESTNPAIEMLPVESCAD